MNQVLTFITKYRRIMLAVLVFLLIVGIQHVTTMNDSVVGLLGIGLLGAVLAYWLGKWFEGKA